MQFICNKLELFDESNTKIIRNSLFVFACYNDCSIRKYLSVGI